MKCNSDVTAIEINFSKVCFHISRQSADKTSFHFCKTDLHFESSQCLTFQSEFELRICVAIVTQIEFQI